MSDTHIGPFPPLQLPPMLAAELETLSQKLVVRNVETYETFLIDNHSRIDETRWKFVASKDDLRAYSEDARGVEPSHRYHAETPVTDLPVVMVAGTVVGNVDDLMYALVCPTTEHMRIRAAYSIADIHGSCVLANVVNPTPETPFTSICIKWIEVQVPLAMRPVAKHRDFVYIETTGIERLRNGERVGYRILHSVQFHETPPLPTHYRGNCSICTIYRQRTTNITDVFMKGVFNPAGDLVRTLVIRSAARLMLSISKDIHCSNMKKLAWALRRRYNSVTSSSSTDSTVESSSFPVEDKSCAACGKKQSVFVQAAGLTTRGSKLMQKKMHCKICTRYMCEDCRKQHKIAFYLPDARVKQRSVTICRTCEMNTVSKSASDICQDEIAHHDHSNAALG
ncbi:hypothetical protein PsorP6_010017 [Peronosclerospora sorghi]|uniref:Uncharacterized protein n=1 Tax=Peronosclerospora sorghi TaxID=230839 RepID=A0ACC0VTK1_9STRA|nr:hypothetical protein PsorP6_010017 [Peronosclerospora sorghi]